MWAGPKKTRKDSGPNQIEMPFLCLLVLLESEFGEKDDPRRTLLLLHVLRRPLQNALPRAIHCKALEIIQSKCILTSFSVISAPFFRKMKFLALAVLCFKSSNIRPLPEILCKEFLLPQANYIPSQQ